MVIKITPQQAKKVNALLRKLCANYNGGNCLLLDRLSLSEKNDWKDEHGRVYQYFTIHQAQGLLHFGHEKVCRLFAELDAADLIGAGQGQPHLLKGVYPKVRFSEFQKSGNRKEIRLRE